MADRLGEFRDALIKSGESQAERVVSGRAIPAGVTGNLAAAAPPAGTAQGNTLAVGYDGANNVTPFMLDVSTLDGPDVLAS